MKRIFKTLILSLVVWQGYFPVLAEPVRPSVLFISIDDLNDWIGCMGVQRFVRAVRIFVDRIGGGRAIRYDVSMDQTGQRAG